MDTALNRLWAEAAPVPFTALKERVDLAGVRVSLGGEAPPVLKFDVQPRAVSLRALPDRPASTQDVPGLKVRTNPGPWPELYALGCGAKPLEVVSLRGRPVSAPTPGVCTDDLQWRIVQPGESLVLPGLALHTLRGLRTGLYLWRLEGHVFAFTLRP